MTTIYRAHLETRNFLFEAFGATDTAARDTLIEGLRIHARQYGLAGDWIASVLVDAPVAPLTLGVAYRDREPLNG